MRASVLFSRPAVEWNAMRAELCATRAHGSSIVVAGALLGDSLREGLIVEEGDAYGEDVWVWERVV